MIRPRIWSTRWHLKVKAKTVVDNLNDVDISLLIIKLRSSHTCRPGRMETHWAMRKLRFW